MSGKSKQLIAFVVSAIIISALTGWAAYSSGYDEGFRHGQANSDSSKFLYTDEIDRLTKENKKIVEDYNKLVNEYNALGQQSRQPLSCTTLDTLYGSSTTCY